MVVEYRQPDGSVKLFGYMMSDGPLNAAHGQMVRGWHSKCYHVARKREARGDLVTGRVVAGTPTGYDIHQLVLSREDLAALGITVEQARRRSTAQLSERLAVLRSLAARLGKGVGDAIVQEAFLAHEHGGGPYAHEHQHRLDTYQLMAHLRYAHGLPDEQLHDAVQDQHALLHALIRQDAILADRVSDEESDPPERDWRIQHTSVIAEPKESET